MGLLTKFRAWLEVRRQTRDERRIREAHERYLYLLRTTPRFWSALAIGGGSSLKSDERVTLKEFREFLGQQGHSIVHEDLEQAFIALQGEPSEAPDPL